MSLCWKFSFVINENNNKTFFAFLNNLSAYISQLSKVENGHLDEPHFESQEFRFYVGLSNRNAVVTIANGFPVKKIWKWIVRWSNRNW